ncbi:MAG: carboxymuconolactone decarboxylase family protein [Thermoplasmatota archaeon]
MTTTQSLTSVPQDLRQDIEQTIGFVPTFALNLSPQGLRLWWTAFRDYEISDKTALPNKTKELIALGIGAQVPSELSVRFHTEFARLSGATEMEIQDAISMAGVARQQATVFYGAPVDMPAFEKELREISANLKTHIAKTAPANPIRR